jgi:putative DNA primase/helicase
MANCKGKRFVVFQEPENDDKIHVGHMKELSGNDKISARALFKEPIEFYPQFKTILTCNKLPFIPSNDGGTWRRLRVAPFEMSFVSDPRESHERKKDKFLKDKMENWKEAFLFILIKRYNDRYKKNGLIEPNKIKEFTNEYKRQSDIFYEYINEQLEFTNNVKDKINLTNMYNDFKIWFKEAHTERKIPTRSEFKDNIEEKIGKLKSNCWKNVIFLQEKNNLIDSDTE